MAKQAKGAAKSRASVSVKAKAKGKAKSKAKGAAKGKAKSKANGQIKVAVAKRPATAALVITGAAASACLGSDLPPAVVLNLLRRPDRWAEVRERLEGLRGGPAFARVDAVDGAGGAEISTDVVTESWSTENNWRYVTRVFEGGEECGYAARELRLTGGERGCAASHVEVWRRCAAELGEAGSALEGTTASCGSSCRRGAGPLLVLEDDAMPTAEFVDRLRDALEALRNESPDLLYLGYTQAAPWRRKVSKCVREAEYLWTTVGYVLWPSGARKLLAALPVDQPVDNFMARLMAAGTLRGFAVVPEILKQAKEWNVDNDVAHSDDAAWVQNAGSSS